MAEGADQTRPDIYAKQQCACCEQRWCLQPRVDRDAAMAQRMQEELNADSRPRRAAARQAESIMKVLT